MNPNLAESPDEGPGPHMRGAEHKPVSRSAESAAISRNASPSAANLPSLFPMSGRVRSIGPGRGIRNAQGSAGPFSCRDNPFLRSKALLPRATWAAQNACNLPDRSAARYRLVPRLWDPGSSSGDSIWGFACKSMDQARGFSVVYDSQAVKP
jgi:hypothetical protein